ncbi:MAG TPA: cytochrome c oxidase subunit II [Longimicrobiales bacterium]|nr:cytochrome c oxidase subunit II [Longimicrobiales bacterium]
MKIHTYEKAFLAVGLILLAACAAALVYATVVHGLHLPGVTGRVDPSNLAATQPFDRPGVYQRGPDAFEAVVIGRAWSFQPAELRVPAGAEITFTATSADVIHGFNVEGTRLNMMLIPGQISRNTYTFDEPGEHLLICHEYCGLGHHVMFGRVIVEPAGTSVPLVDGPAAAVPAHTVTH